ncbi:unnamed protein product [Lepeophtheirus salmonis]|uniref:(salmon louse) hypothetical protein n=1 Tax=Lepeophtheirus salmonis TaxID=72036 RepID=A0A7R8H514_LEPSM|nr:unnamed protein product [Lepeophtheirus salmonis]CAF2859868.1 unnamed protein product [Lepeophtheirus salmonis]
MRNKTFSLISTAKMNGQLFLLFITTLLVHPCISRSCSKCRPEMNENCCTSTADSNGFCENLIHETYLEVSEDDRLVIPCDTGTLCISGEVEETRCVEGIHPFYLLGIFQSGKCDITVIDYNDQIHEGRWSVDVRLEKVYSDQVIVDTDGLRTSEVLGISSTVIIIIIIIIVAIIIWRCCPNVCNKKPKEPVNTYRPPPGQDVYETLNRHERVSAPHSVEEIYVHSQDLQPRASKLIVQELKIGIFDEQPFDFENLRVGGIMSKNGQTLTMGKLAFDKNIETLKEFLKDGYRALIQTVL